MMQSYVVLLPLSACLAMPIPGSGGDDRFAEIVLAQVKHFFAQTANPDGSFRPCIDPAYEGVSDSAFSDLAPVTYAVTLHKTFGWKLPHEEETKAFLLSRQKEDGAFFNVK